MPNHKFPSLSAPMDKFPWSNSIHHMNQVQAVPTYSWVADFRFPPACRIIQTTQSHSSMEIKGHLYLLILQSLPHAAPGCLLCSRGQPLCGSTWSAVISAPELWVRVTNKLLSTSSVQSWMLCVQTSTCPRVGIPLSPMGSRGGNENIYQGKHICLIMEKL